VAAATLVSLRGMLRGHPLTEMLEQEHREELERERRKWGI
jgi:hypothetical protein